MNKVIYLLGAGRSGTTILSIILGNNDNAINLGELNRYFLRNGEPHGFPKESNKYKIWIDFKKMYFPNFISAVSSVYKFENHRYLFQNLLGLFLKKKKEDYTKVVNKFYQSLFEYFDKSLIIDASKYPNRCFSLNKYLNHAEVYNVYLVRNPIGVINSFSKKDIEQDHRGYISANFYYFIANLLSHMVFFNLPKSKRIKIKYEDVLNNPTVNLEKIERKFNLDLSKSKNIVAIDGKLDTGYQFDGNRIRLKNYINLKKENSINHPKSFKDYVTLLINGFWYYL